MDTPYLVFCCYAREDKVFLKKLETHLMSLVREGLIVIKADIHISPGAEWEPTLMRYLAEAHILLLLISPDFIASDYCFHEEMSRALERHKQGTARVIPVIVRPANWHRMPFGQLQALPADAVPISISPDQDTALMNVTKGVRQVVQELKASTSLQQNAARAWQPPIQKDVLSPDQRERNTMGTKEEPGSSASENRGNIYGGQFNNGQFNAPIFTGEGQNITYNAAPDKQKEGLLALERGAGALLNADYVSARKLLRAAINEIDPNQLKEEAALASYLNALAVLGYGRPQDKGTTDRNTMNELLSAAIRLDRRGAYIMTKALIMEPSLPRQVHNLQMTDYDRTLLGYVERCQPELRQRILEVFGI